MEQGPSQREGVIMNTTIRCLTDLRNAKRIFETILLRDSEEILKIMKQQE